jgi:hypothetical protein
MFWLHCISIVILLYNMYLHDESGDVDAYGVAQTMSQLPILLSNYMPEDVYNMDETGWYFITYSNKTLA